MILGGYFFLFMVKGKPNLFLIPYQKINDQAYHQVFISRFAFSN